MNMKMNKQLIFGLIILTVVFTVFLFLEKNNREEIQSIQFNNIELPYTLVKLNTKEEINAIAQPNIKITENNNYIHLPNINGQLTLKVNQATLYQDYEYVNTGVLSSRSILIKIPKSIDFIYTIEVNINDVKKSLINLSALKIGRYSDFILSHQFINYYYSGFSDFILGIASFVFLVSLIFYIKGDKHFISYHIPTISAYILFSELINHVTLLNDYIFVPGTFSALIVLIFFDWINSKYKEKIKLSPFIFILLTVLPIAACISQVYLPEFNIGQYQLFFNLPVTIIFSMICIFHSTIKIFRKSDLTFEYTKTDRTLLILQSSPLMFMAISFLHGILAKFSLIDTGFYLIPLVKIYFLLILAVISVLNESIYKQRENIKYKKLLNQKTNELTVQLTHLGEAEKLRALHIQKETFFTELHDGVLGNLSIIHSIAERNNQYDYNQIRKLTKYSINEIRLMLEIDLNVHQQYETLFITCSLLRQQIVEPLALLDVHITWNMTKLLEYKKTSASFNLEIFRVLQEAIHNAHERAEAKEITITSYCQGDKFFITVKNQRGIAFDPNYPRGLGISSMISRCKSIDCIFSITPLPGGAELTIALP